MTRLPIYQCILPQYVRFCKPHYSKYVTKTNQSTNLVNPWNATRGLG